MSKEEQTRTLDRGMRIWIRKTARANLWRMPTWMVLDDLISEGYLCFAKCHARYLTVSQPKFMALVKRSFHNRITDLSKERTRMHEIPVSTLVTEPHRDDGFFESLLGAETDCGRLLELITSAPDDVKAVFNLVFGDSRNLALGTRRFLNGRRETTNAVLCRLLGKNPALVDLPTMVRDYLAGAGAGPVDLQIG